MRAVLKNEITILRLLFLTLAGYFSVAALISEAPAEGGADNYQHYQIARWAFEYPHLFLDHWGKPFFTLLISPFAQFGFEGAKVFNVLMGLWAAWLSFLVCKKLQQKNAWLVIVILCFMPMYFSMMNSSMTEVLCSTMLIGCVYLFYNEKYFWCAIATSFLPFVRTEVFILLPFFAFALLLKKQHKTIPLLLTGFILYSIVGWFYYHDFLWMFTRNPYTGAKDIYGHGGLFDFVKANKAIWGIPVCILIIAGYLQLVFKEIIWDKNMHVIFEIVLVLLPAIVHLLLHSYLWWQGLGGSLGLTRVITCVLPLYAITALRGYNLIAETFPLPQAVKYFLSVVAVVLIIIIPFRNKAILPPIKFDETEKMVERACQWIKNNNLKKNKIYFIHPLVPMFLDKNQFDEKQMHYYFGGVCKAEDNVPEGGIIFWDSHFGNNEGHLKIQTLIENGQYKILKIFYPVINLPNGLGNYKRRIIIWQKTNEPDFVQPILLSLDFDSYSKLIDKTHVSGEQHFSQNNSFKLIHDEFSPTLNYSLQKIKSAGYHTIYASVNVFIPGDAKENTVSLVINFSHGGKIYSYYNTNSEASCKPNMWNQLDLSVNVPDSISKNDTLTSYMWQRKGLCFIDDFEIQLR